MEHVLDQVASADKVETLGICVEEQRLRLNSLINGILSYI